MERAVCRWSLTTKVTVEKVIGGVNGKGKAKLLGENSVLTMHGEKINL